MLKFEPNLMFSAAVTVQEATFELRVLLASLAHFLVQVPGPSLHLCGPSMTLPPSSLCAASTSI